MTKPREHVLKTWPTYWDAVARGDKTFEGRKNDRDFTEGDLVVLQRTVGDRLWKVEIDEASGKPIKQMRFRIGFVLHGGQFGIESGWCVFSLIALEEQYPEEYPFN